MATYVMPSSTGITNQFHVKQFGVREQLLEAFTPSRLTTDQVLRNQTLHDACSGGKSSSHLIKKIPWSICYKAGVRA
jgi:hypothetical protein